MNKKILVIGGIFIFLIILIGVFNFFAQRNTIKQSASSISTSPIVIQLPKETITQPIPRANPAADLKKKISGSYQYKDITLDYKPKIDVIVVYWEGDETRAKEQAAELFQLEGIEKQEALIVEYIELARGQDQLDLGEIEEE